ncbi:MAG: hypothetical protein AB8A49_02270 [Prochlorococcus sp.]|jgi:hypothetical protein|nr:hypothetical protein [Prochlorococcaceae cyanobacterium ETNP2_MAG_10]MDP6196584.1 hypothetical protein [Prochlorococcaceae cyanobacterium ETNP18_MAG_17]MDP6321352.1 hypothetical protein [Prochlorococcaceae cyanobacterium ETNP14_MAG_5]MDP6851145.1 hypothetical protein [Prochlorococcaceae cyanobacterium ETNP1_MAG_8]MDP7328179.1 hypothetical protein [Prochlorococcaceae cyanobacterium ETNP7_MAG_30]|tara:strand:- start:2058 stop:2288 length:231 start_codon:yes stop_codon:yes gene_type:complete
MSSNASELYERIQNDPKHTKVLFRQALQDPQGALQAICDLGQSMGLPVTPDEVKAHLASLDDAETKQWLIKARGGL